MKSKLSRSSLYVQRDSIQFQLKTFVSIVENWKLSFCQSNITKMTDEQFAEFSFRYDKINQLYAKFNVIQDNIETICDIVADELEIRNQIDNDFCTALASAKVILDKCQISENKGSSSNNISQNEIDFIHSKSVKLPIINLPKFYGNYHEWLEYRDTFTSVIHNNNTIDDILKFQYLKSSVLGEAAKIINFLETSQSSYGVAWKLLCNRYDKKRLLVNNHIKALFNIDSLGKESAKGIRNIINEISQHLRALEILEQPVDQWDSIIIFLITSKLDSITVREWEMQVKDNELPSREMLFNFLSEKADTLENINGNFTTSNKHSNSQNSNEKYKCNNHKAHNNDRIFLSTDLQKCVICNGAHNISVCTEFIKLSIEKRIELAKTKRLCLNCLRSGHYINECKSSSCKKCNRKHNTLLHLYNLKQVSQDTNKTINDQKIMTCTQEDQTKIHALLATALIDVVGSNGQIYSARAILDCGAQSNLITKDLCKKLNISTDSVKIELTGIGQVSSKIIEKCSLTIKSRENCLKKLISCLVIQSICDEIPHSKIDISKLHIPKQLKLADPQFYEPSKIDILLGANIFWDILEAEQIKLGESLPIIQRTKLGWVISGPIPHITNNIFCNFCKTKDDTNDITDIQQQLSKFWKLEECLPETVLSQEELNCENHFIKNTVRDSTSRFIVAIPFKETLDRLGESREKALGQLFALEKRLNNTKDLKLLYNDFMLEYLKLGHMSESKSSNESKSYYMPHHSVLKEENITTKIRVVFNASSKTSSGISLNETQMVGPTIQNDLMSILLRFREHTFVVCADIAKMYRQIMVQPDHRRYQKILWRFNSNDEIKEYCLNTVTYGTSSAPFLAIRCLYQLGIENADKYQNACKRIINDFYVDDLLTGGEDEIELASQCLQVSNILKSGCFDLRKWKSNNPNILYKLTCDKTEPFIKLGQNEKSKTLGIFWSCHDDKLTYKINAYTNSTQLTKRLMLSTISQIFDPLGLLAICTITAKIILQHLWLQNLTWDDPVPDIIRIKWIKFINELAELNQLCIPRHVSLKNCNKKEIHIFCDASKEAYGACAYIRSIDIQNEKLISNLLCAKSKVAPLKPLSIPRLELCAALIGARLLEKLLKSTNIHYNKCILWSDSTIVLSWIKTRPHLLKSFVCNRIVEIQNLTKSCTWKYVSTKDNPADFLSRGLSPSLVKDCSIWWYGPSWICKDESDWPTSIFNSQIEIPELRQKQKSQTLACIEIDENIFQRFSKFNHMIRVFAFCIRFKHNCLLKHQQKPRNIGILTIDELEHTQQRLIYIIQSITFRIEHDKLLNGKDLPRNSKILNLNPFLDSNKLIRVGGRLKASQFAYNKKYPIIIPGNHHFTKLLFKHEHIRLLHAGIQQLLYSIREKFWIISGRDIAKQTVRNCVQCFKAKPKVETPIMGNLPASRISQMHPFAVCGVDYGGPFVLKDRKGRGCKKYKAYMSLFVCFVTKAIHIELVTDLTNDAFMAALRRFIARRGYPIEINSDNGTNFVGANNELNGLGTFLRDNKTNLEEHFIGAGINWKFIPPHSPHMGGLWEAGIRSAKFHIKRVAANALLTYEEFITLLTQIEAILNSRPLTQLSTDPNEPHSLTPSRFLIGRPTTTIPDPNYTQISESRLAIYQKLQLLIQHFWSRWAKEYISELQQRTKWKIKAQDISIGTVVLIKEDNLPPSCWLLGKVEEVHPGSDGIVRVATVKTSKGIVKRTVQKLCPLPNQN